MQIRFLRTAQELTLLGILKCDFHSEVHAFTNTDPPAVFGSVSKTTDLDSLLGHRSRNY